MSHVPRIGRILDLVGVAIFLVGAGLGVRAWLGFREVQNFVPAPDDPPMAAVQIADSFWRLQKVGVGLMLLGVAVFAVAWWVAGRGRSGGGPRDGGGVEEV